MTDRSIEPFTYDALPQRVVFGWGTVADVGAEIDRLGVSRALVLTGPRQAAAGQGLARSLRSRCVGTYSGAAMHTPVHVTAEAVARARAVDADVLVALGGGSAIGLAKAIALRTNLLQVVIPTTYAGSEATPVVGETADGRKTTERSFEVLPEVIVYDVDLTMTLDPAMSIVSGLNAIAHAVEALYARERNPIVSLLAEKGIAAMAAALPAIRQNPHDRDGRAAALLGAWTCGTCLGMVGMALHHKICHTLGGSFGLPHAETHAVILPHAVAYNERAASAELSPIAHIFGAPSAASGLSAFAASLGAPVTLSELGMKPVDIEHAVETLLQNPFWNPQPLVAAEIRAILDDACVGRNPGASLRLTARGDR